VKCERCGIESIDWTEGWKSVGATRYRGVRSGMASWCPACVTVAPFPMMVPLPQGFSQPHQFRIQRVVLPARLADYTRPDQVTVVHYPGNE
jgi:hypothetical protein